MFFNGGLPAAVSYILNFVAVMCSLSLLGKRVVSLF